MLPNRINPSSANICGGVFAGLMLISVVAAAASPPATKASVDARSLIAGNEATSPRTPSLVAQAPTPTPSYIPWYTAVPSPIPSAYAALGAAFGAAYLYNTLGTAGTGVLNTGGCNFICFGSPGVTSHHMLAYGNDIDPTGLSSYTSQGAPDDCGSSCPGDIRSQVFSITAHSDTSLPNSGFFVSVDGNANLGVYNNIVAGAAVIAGAGDGSPEPSPNPGSLVSYTGKNSSGGGEGDVLLGSAGDFAKCDYGETANAVLTCNQQLAVTKGVQPNGTSGGYAAETFPLGVAEQHPKILSAICNASFGSPPNTCTFPNSFAFADTTYNCTIAPLGSTPIAFSYSRTSTTQITIYSATSADFSYTCIR